MYNYTIQKYPTFQLEGPTPSAEQMAKADMYLPPCIVIDPNFAPENFQPLNNVLSSALVWSTKTPL